MTNNSQSFSNINEFKDYFVNNLNIENGFKELENLHGNASNILALETSNQIILSFIKNEELSFFDIEDILDTGKIEIFSSKDNYLSVMKDVKKSKKLYYLIDKYEHGNVHYSVSSTESYPDQQFDVAKGCGIYIPHDEIQSQYKKMKRKEGEHDAFMHFIPESNHVLNDYSNWCNGEFYNMSVIVFNKEGKCIHETNFDFISGYDNALKINDDTVNHLIAEYNTEDLLKDIVIEDKSIKDVKSMPFKIKQKDLISFKHVNIFRQHLVAATYENNSGTFYQYKEGDEKPVITKFNCLPEDINLEHVLNTEMNVYLKKIILLDQQKEIEKKSNKNNQKVI